MPRPLRRLGLFEKFKRVTRRGAMTSARQMIELPVPLCLLHRGLGKIDAGDFGRAAAARVDRETAGVSKKVEHRAVPGKRPDASTIVALIEEESGLLPLHQVGLEVQTVLEKAHRFSGNRPAHGP